MAARVPQPMSTAAPARVTNKQPQARPQISWATLDETTSKTPPKPFELDDFEASADEKELPPPLSWRQDPTTSLSDWTLRVSVDPSSASGCTRTKDLGPSYAPLNTEVVYHCHKVALGVGPRALQYFQPVFQGGGFVEQADSSSTFELQASAVEAMPALLDFVYTGELKATSDNAVALMHLAKYLRGAAAYTAVCEFIQKDLTWFNSPTYLLESNLYSFEKVAAAALELCAANMDKNDKISNCQLYNLTPELFQDVLESNVLSCSSEKLGLLVAEFSKKHDLTTDPNILLALTPVALMPTVGKESALLLLDLALQCDTTGNPNSTEQLQPLIGRCVDAVSAHYREIFEPDFRSVFRPNGSPKPPAWTGPSNSPAAEAPDEPLTPTRRQRSTAIQKTSGLRQKDLPVEVKLDVLEGALRLAHEEIDQARRALESLATRLPHEVRQSGFAPRIVQDIDEIVKVLTA